MLLSFSSPRFSIFMCFRSSHRQLFTDQHHSAATCRFVSACSSATSLISVLYCQYTVHNTVYNSPDTAYNSPYSSLGLEPKSFLALKELTFHLSACQSTSADSYSTNRKIIFLISAQGMGSATVMAVIYLELLVPDPFLTTVRKTPLRGLHSHLGADECCLKVAGKEDANTSTHPDFN